MPRPRIFRKIRFQPEATYFKPAGIRMSALEETILSMDEFEALRLKDLEDLDQEKAAKKMGISQPTFHRLVLSARKKVADSLVNGKSIKIQGGNFKMIQPRGRGAGVGAGRGAGAGRGFKGPSSLCVCTKCGHSEPKQRGIPCIEMKCPKCNAPMIRK